MRRRPACASRLCVRRAWLLVLTLVLSALLSACQSSVPLSRRVSREKQEALSPLQWRLLAEVRRRLGTPYCYGGADESCMDCSGFVQHVFAALGIQLPRTSSEQAAAGSEVQGIPKLGDIVIVCTGSRVRHVGIYLGNGTVAHATRSRGVVIEPLSSVAAIGSAVRFRRLVPLSTP